MTSAAEPLEGRNWRGGSVWRVSAGILLLCQFGSAVALTVWSAHQSGEAGAYGVIFGVVLTGITLGTSLIPAIFVFRGGRSAMTSAIVLQSLFAILIVLQAAQPDTHVAAILLPAFIIPIALLLKARSIAIPSPPAPSAVPLSPDGLYWWDGASWQPTTPHQLAPGVGAPMAAGRPSGRLVAVLLLCVFQCGSFVLNAVEVFTQSPVYANAQRIPAVIALSFTLIALTAAALTIRRWWWGPITVIGSQLVFGFGVFIELQPWPMTGSSLNWLNALAGFAVLGNALSGFTVFVVIALMMSTGLVRWHPQAQT